MLFGRLPSAGANEQLHITMTPSTDVRAHGDRGSRPTLLIAAFTVGLVSALDLLLAAPLPRSSTSWCWPTSWSMPC